MIRAISWHRLVSSIMIDHWDTWEKCFKKELKRTARLCAVIDNDINQIGLWLYISSPWRVVNLSSQRDHLLLFMCNHILLSLNLNVHYLVLFHCWIITVNYLTCASLQCVVISKTKFPSRCHKILTLKNAGPGFILKETTEIDYVSNTAPGTMRLNTQSAQSERICDMSFLMGA